MSTLTFDIAQFFPSLNHQLLSHIFYKASFNLKVSFFFQNYLVGWKTQYVCDSFSLFFYNVDVEVGQDLALSSILSALYISPILHIFENHLKFLKIFTSFILFVNNGLLVVQNKFLSVLNSLLFCSYQIVSSLLDRFSLKLEHGKMEVFYFSRSSSPLNPPPLDFSPISGPILQPKNLWRYLGFIFNRKLTFCHHIDFYADKAIFTVKYMKLLGNSSHGLISQQKYL